MAVQVPGVDERAILQVENTNHLPLLNTFTTCDGTGSPLSCHPPVKNTMCLQTVHNLHLDLNEKMIESSVSLADQIIIIYYTR